jgi:hypothetical protein
VRVAERVEPKGVCISVLRNEAMLCDVWEAEDRVSTAVRYIDVFSTKLRRFRTCRFRCSGGTAARDRQITLFDIRRSVAFA